jgi:hypothetical protein
MGEAKVGDKFVTHEFDEAIAIQRAIVEAETSLAKSHPHAESKAAISTAPKEDKTFLCSSTSWEGRKARPARSSTSGVPFG